MAARSVPPSSRGGAQLVWMRFSAARERAPSPQTTRAHGAELLLRAEVAQTGRSNRNPRNFSNYPP